MQRLAFTRVKENRNFSDAVDGEAKALQELHGLSAVAVGPVAQFFQKPNNMKKKKLIWI
jgi:hypothetical protein